MIRSTIKFNDDWVACQAATWRRVMSLLRPRP